ncbi:protein involved in polysaccharide export, contains SLBB domain of the beta-grasp fold [Chitinophaga jiangningensis]|uniref:Protein involved in polysaccharide export, contains SLBB domain of the beta-grasp fold n=1 Tax=Chitinophaga jiangningensis TaxID=1419482 RepID=A0A1M7HJB0_9BACT|nr:SLBB domain-containing protein [Chitinophaga jiangningensis]SHM28575.1 protein involved in polysaccharide export, contains SLBB domain of the beta-grasp fold [Chitinophaga jiangningensis]
MLRKLLLIQLFLFVVYSVNAQVPSFSKEQMKQMKVDNLSDDQVRQLVAEMKKNNLSFDDIDTYAQQKGIPDVEASKLKDRIRAMGLDKELTGNKTKTKQDAAKSEEREVDDEDDKAKDSTEPKLTKEEKEREKRRKRIFGAELFSNKNLTFEPNLRMATPPNYRLAANDELLIDVYGYSEVQHRLKVTPDGYIRIPNLGPVYVNGLTIEEAKNRITKQLATIYSGIKSGNTFVQMSLGSIRSIRVLLIGEVEKPGSYTVPSLATVANALYVSGGPNENGSFRNIQVIRNGVPAATFDLYDFLANGDLTNNIVLQDQDIVKINPYKTRIELAGEVKRPAIFEAKENESLQRMIEFAGGYTDRAYTDVIRGYRVNNKEREVVNITADQLGNFKVKSGDNFVVDSILNRYSNRVTISGAVFHPGNYALEEGMTITDLLKRADGVREEASLTRGLIRRLQADFTPAYINFNVQDAVAGKSNITLQKEDSVMIYSKLDLREEYEVRIDGEVNKPGYYAYGDSMHLEDLILLAGGLNDAASTQHIEVSRRIRNGVYSPQDTVKAIVQYFDVNKDLSTNPDAQNFVLLPFDEVSIRRSPVYSRQANVSIGGEVVYPGDYTINTRAERISDLIKRTGGLRPEAYAEGAVMLRKTFINEGDSLILANKLEVFINKLQDSADIVRVKESVSRHEQLLGINLDQIIKNPGSKYDLLLEEGDVIRVPKKLQTVQLFGEVYFPKKVRFDNNYTFRDYIHGAGGFTSQALKRRSYIVYPNGEVKNTKRVFFFNSYPKVKPGAEVYVPAKKEKKGLSGQEGIAIASGLASIALVIVTILNTVK